MVATVARTSVGERPSWRDLSADDALGAPETTGAVPPPAPSDGADVARLDPEAAPPGISATAPTATSERFENTVRRDRAQRLLDDVLTQPPSQRLYGAEITALNFTSGESAALIDTGHEASVLVHRVSAERADFYRVEGGRITERLLPGDSAVLAPLDPARADRDAGLTVGEGRLSLYYVAAGDERSTGLHVAAGAGTVTAASVPSYTEAEPANELVTRSLTAGAAITRPGSGGAPLTETEAYDFYRTTAEGRRILDEEGDAAYGTAEGRRLFVARVRYDRGEGGRELFDEFTPDRAALSGEALARHDAIIDEALAEMDHQGLERGSADGRMDPSMKYIVASGLVEAFGGNEGLIRRLRRDINRHWMVDPDWFANEGAAGTYSKRNPLFHRARASITFDTAALLRSYADPNDRFDIIAHEGAHSLDRYRRTNGDGVPTYMSASGERALVAARVDAVERFRTSGGTDTSGLGSYAFTNRKEFWAEVSEAFVSADSGRQAIANLSPALYNELRIFYGMLDLPVLPVTP